MMTNILKRLKIHSNQNSLTNNPIKANVTVGFYFFKDIFIIKNNKIMQLIYINNIGKNHNHEYSYEFFFTDDIDSVWGYDWEVKPASICQISPPEESMIVKTEILQTIINLDLAQDNNCFSMQDSIDGIIPIAWENISEYEEYPEDGRLIIHYGLTYEKVVSLINNKNLTFKK